MSTTNNASSPVFVIVSIDNVKILLSEIEISLLRNGVKTFLNTERCASYPVLKYSVYTNMVKCDSIGCDIFGNRCIFSFSFVV